MRPARLALAGVLLAGALVTAVNADLPLVRNALLFAQIERNIKASPAPLWELCSDPEVVFNKPCSFAVVASPLVSLVGANLGFRLASFLGTALFALAALAFFRRFNRLFGLGEAAVPLELLLTFLNPLTLYQFWSGYPDMFFAAAFVWGIVAADRVFTGQARPITVLGYLAALVGGVVLKNWAVVVFPLHAVLALWRRRDLRATWRGGGRRELVLLVGAVVLAAGFVLLGVYGYNPFVSLEGNSEQMMLPASYQRNLAQIAVMLATVLGPLVLVLPWVRADRRNAILLILAAGYGALFCTFHGSAYNARYHLPILPLLVPFLAAALGRMAAPARRVALAAFVLLNLVSTAVFNSRTVHTAVAGRLPRDWFAEFSYLDCYRMAAHLEMARALDLVNQRVPAGGKLTYVSSYYGGGGFQVYQADGLLRRDLRITYASSLDADALHRGDYVFLQPPMDPTPPDNAEVVGPRLSRVP
jgi:hypothetical protein